MSHPAKDPKKRFWEKVGVRGEDECWEWKGDRHPFGYGRFNNGEGRIVNSHRYVMQITLGEIPDGMRVLHKCDNAPCVNPNHLYLGTAKQNTKDMKDRKRSTFGERNRHAKLTEAQVLSIRKLRRGGVPYKELMRDFGVSVNTIRRVVYLETWAYLEESEV